MGGIQPELRAYLEDIEGALNGDILMSISPATTGTAATSTAFTRDITVSIVNAAGDTLEWVNAAFTTTVSEAVDTAGSGDSTIPTTLTLVNGVAVVTLSCTGAWAEADTSTVTIGNIVLGGIAVTGGTSVDTIIA